MKSNRYQKLTGSHAGRTFVVTAPASEIDTTLHWILHCEAARDQVLTVSEDELTNPKLWQPLA